MNPSRMLRGTTLAAFIAVASCSSSTSTSTSTGTAQIVGLALTSADVASVRLTVSGPGISPNMVIPLTKTGIQWSGVVGGIPAGTGRVFLLEAFTAAATKIYQGQATDVTITAGATVTVSITAQELMPPPPLSNAAPVIDAVVASSTAIKPDQSITVRVQAHDPNPGDTLTTSWSATGGTFASPGAAETQWTAPAADSTHQLTVSVSDGKVTARLTFAVSVAASNGGGSASVAATVNGWPVVSNVSADPARVTVGVGTALQVSVTDPDGDPLAYAWSSWCAGTFSSTTMASTAFTLGTEPASHECTIQVMVSDGRGGSNTGTLTLPAGPPPSVNQPPQIGLASQSSSTVNAGQTVQLLVEARDPEGTEIAFAWTATVGSLGTPTSTAARSEVTWTAPNCFATGGSAEIAARITDATGLETVQRYTLQAGSGATSCVQPIASDSNTVILDHLDGATAGTAVGPISYEGSQTTLGQAVSLSNGRYVRYAFSGWSGGSSSSGTIELWIKPMSRQALIDVNWGNSATVPSAGHVVGLGLDPTTGVVNYGVWNGSGGTTGMSGTSAVALGVWSHVAVTWSPGGTRIYVNGILEATNAANIWPSLQGTNYLYLNYWGTENFVGAVDDLHLSSSARSASEIATHAGR